VELGRALVLERHRPEDHADDADRPEPRGMATPATAYVLQIAASIPVASADDDTQLKVALSSVIDDILQHAIRSLRLP